jgi:hypothetical protein
MYKATRDFLKARGKHCQSSLVLPTHVEQLRTGEPYKCFENSRAFVAEKKANGENYISLSGWLVGPYDAINESTEIIQHWWVGDATGKHYDTSPNIKNGEEYVLDFNITNFAFANYDKIESCVAKSLLYKKGKFYLLENVTTMELKEIKELKTELFFKYI